MWGLLATSHATMTAIENLANKPYFCLDLLANFEDLLRPVDSRSIILGIFDTFLPCNMESHWARWMIVEQFFL